MKGNNLSRISSEDIELKKEKFTLKYDKEVVRRTDKRIAIERCLEARKKAILLKYSRTKVGACIYTRDGHFYEGFNIQNRSHKSYHAEEIAVLNCIINDVPSNIVEGIIISFSKNDISRLTFMCGHCRQIVWEYTKNPNLLVIEVDLEGNIIKEMKLGELYNYPYPR